MLRYDSAHDAFADGARSSQHLRETNIGVLGDDGRGMPLPYGQIGECCFIRTSWLEVA